MKHYEQTCAIARALDIVGDRWSLLLVRELTLGPRRYPHPATGLPGIPTTLLAAPLAAVHRPAPRAPSGPPTPSPPSRPAGPPRRAALALAPTRAPPRPPAAPWSRSPQS